jgi:hypothetical protein
LDAAKTVARENLHVRLDAELAVAKENLHVHLDAAQTVAMKSLLRDARALRQDVKLRRDEMERRQDASDYPMEARRSSLERLKSEPLTAALRRERSSKRSVSLRDSCMRGGVGSSLAFSR